MLYNSAYDVPHFINAHAVQTLSKLQNVADHVMTSADQSASFRNLYSANYFPHFRRLHIAEDRLQSGSADIQSPQHLDPVVPATPSPKSRTRPQPAIDHYGAASTFHDDSICETRFSVLCTSCLESLPKTVLNSDSLAVFKSRLKTFLFSQAFPSFSLTHCLLPAR